MTHSAPLPAALVSALDVRDFRNLARVELEPPAEGLVVVGENGQGKTNLLEAVYYLHILRSARAARDVDLVRFGADGFHIAAHVRTDADHDVSVGFERATKRKRVKVDGAVVERLGDALGALPSVMFSPADVELVAGSPASRRRYLDIMLALTVRGYLNALQRYRAALLRRNAALRDVARGGKPPGAGVAVWEPPLAEHGAVLWRARRDWVRWAHDRFEELCHAIGESGRMRLKYAAPLHDTDDMVAALSQALADKRVHDARRGLTHAGPHRDELVMTLDARELRTFGSAGQQRTAAIALRMLEAATLREALGRSPVFLLDDPFAELDVRRTVRILELLEGHGLGQTLLAVPRESDIPRELSGLERLRMSAGVVTPFV